MVDFIELELSQEFFRRDGVRRPLLYKVGLKSRYPKAGYQALFDRAFPKYKDPYCDHSHYWAELLEIYNWWIKEFPKRDKFPNILNSVCSIEPKLGAREKIYIDTMQEEEDTEMMNRLVAIRGILWT